MGDTSSPVAPETSFSFERPHFLDVDARGIGFFSFYAPPKKLGAATFYLGTFKDAKGDLLRGGATYRLHVPASVPAKQFWALTLYDRQTCGFIRDMPRAGVDSYDQKMQKNADGSVDVYIGPKAPEGKEANWIQTVPGRGWFPYFRFYGPEKPLFDKTWVLPEPRRSTALALALIPPGTAGHGLDAIQSTGLAPLRDGGHTDVQEVRRGHIEQVKRPSKNIFQFSPYNGVSCGRWVCG